MTIPQFDARGLLPPGVHAAALAALDDLAATDVRRALLAALRRFIAAELLPWAAGLELDVAGSFLSDKPEPPDIDCTLRVPIDRLPACTAQVLRVGTAQAKLRIEREYALDFYVTIATLGADFSAFFQYVGEKTAALRQLQPRDLRGIVRLTL